jgi:hypothetical protein
MPESFAAFCSDWYINLRLNVKLDLPLGRENVLGLFESLRKSVPGLEHFRRTKLELALESAPVGDQQSWVVLKRRSVRAGMVNPPDLATGHALQQQVLSEAPFHLSLSTLDVSSLEIMYGFDLPCSGNHDAVVMEALLPRGPLASLVQVKNAIPMTFQPVVGLALSPDGTVQAQYEVRTRSYKGPGAPAEAGPASGLGGGYSPSSDFSPGGSGGEEGEEGEGAMPMSVLLALRTFNTPRDIKQLPQMLKDLTTRGDELLLNKVVPDLLRPIHHVISTNNL